MIGLNKALRSFSSDRRGNVAIIFALTAIPAMLITGIGVDYAKALSVRSKLQNAADAAALAGANPVLVSDGEKVLAANSAFNSNAKDLLGRMSVGHEVAINDGVVTVTTSANVPAAFMSLLPFVGDGSPQAAVASSFPVSTTSSASAKSNRTMEVSMMLDVTGSMAGQKLEDLKFAAKDLMNIVMAVDDSKTRVALVPFADRVNAGIYTPVVTGLPETYRETKKQCVRWAYRPVKDDKEEDKDDEHGDRDDESDDKDDDHGDSDSEDDDKGDRDDDESDDKDEDHGDRDDEDDGKDDDHGDSDSEDDGKDDDHGDSDDESDDKDEDKDIDEDKGDDEYHDEGAVKDLGNESDGGYDPDKDKEDDSDSEDDGKDDDHGDSDSEDDSKDDDKDDDKGDRDDDESDDKDDDKGDRDDDESDDKDDDKGDRDDDESDDKDDDKGDRDDDESDDKDDEHGDDEKDDSVEKTERYCAEYAQVETGKVKQLISCVTARVSSERYTSAEPALKQYVGPYLPGQSTTNQYSVDPKCRIPEIKPLTSDINMLRNHVDSFVASGDTAGHLGTAWSWYTVSPQWNNVFPVSSAAKSYGNKENIKAVVLMTDGDYNTSYGNKSSSSDMARRYCQEMKDAGVIIYTVGFGVPAGSKQRATLEACASSAANTFFPYDGAQLRKSFNLIGAALATAKNAPRLIK